MTVVTFHTESGDEGVVGVFSREPTKRELNIIAAREYPEEHECGCIYFDTYEIDGVTEL